MALADIYRGRRGVGPNFEKAFAAYTSAARFGDPGGHRGMGEMLLNGEGRQADPRRAFGHFLKAAQDGDETAMIAVAEMYRDGRGVEAEAAQALRWLEEAARRESSSSPRLIGDLYLSRKLPHAEPQAAALGWYLVSSLYGDPLGRSDVRYLTPFLRTDQLKTAEQYAEAFLRTVTR